jgi:hypothetical protein
MARVGKGATDDAINFMVSLILFIMVAGAGAYYFIGKFAESGTRYSSTYQALIGN